MIYLIVTCVFFRFTVQPLT